MLRLLASGCARGPGPGVGARPVVGLCHPGLRQSRQASDAPRNQPPSPEVVARSVGICSMMRLPVQTSPEGLDAAFIGVPLDTGTSNRPGARWRSHNHVSHIASDGKKGLMEVMERAGLKLPLPRSEKGHGPVGLLHVDAHTDTADEALGEKLYHGAPFRRCVDEGLLDCKRVAQIGIRGYSTTLDPYRYNRSQGFRVVLAEDCWMKSLVPLMAEVRQQMGGKPIYISFDIDALDPAYAPGTGTPEIAGLTPGQALEIIRGCQGLNVVGCDLVEVSPPYDLSGNTALLAANLLFEMLCALPKVTTV
ncbi:agmatinase, mitochondrial isoform X2 [Macaca thibetana thibetana]|uniref:agmatinase, mitochondrial isoform X2 n=1 Tax=Macaca thibetana thibetana TaxID=257877 RepID=UPI0021BCEBAB|nr:agmatinase, mitochondrial isoform X2 [Macaca thibetana thibetana]